MCGIAAVISEETSFTLERSQMAIASLRHRGPDSTGFWQSKNKRVSLAHCRLGTIDLLTGVQPICNEDETVIAVVNGEFYGFEEIRTELERQGHRFKTKTDSEILVHLYEQYNTSCLEHLQGEFAFVLWDEREQILLAVRDRFGAKPLYYSESRQEIVFSSEVKGLKAAGATLAWDHQGFFDTFVFNASLSGRTLYHGVMELPPGHYFQLKNGSSSVRKYWDINFPLDDGLEASRPDEFYAGTLVDLLNQAVQTRMRADVPIACYLSGGIDSNSILGLMTRHSARPVQSFCLSFDDPKYDEFELAAQSAARLGSQLVKVPATDKSLADDFPEAIWHCESLIENANVVGKFALSRAVNAAGFRVVLTGDGSDEVFAGYPIFIMDCLRHGTAEESQELQHHLGLSSEGLQQLLFPEGRTAPEPLNSRLGYFPTWLEIRNRLLGQFGMLFDHWLGEKDIYTRLLDSLDVCGQLKGRGVLNQSLYIHAKTSLPGVTLSSLGERVEMAHSVESRLPFLDHRVVEFAKNLPCSQKIRKGAEKYILRKAMRSVLPPEICGRRKRPIEAPRILGEVKSALGDVIQDLLRSRWVEGVPFLDRKATRELLDRMMLEDVIVKPGLESSLMALASACVLAEKFAI
jgi:asparagine synthase (glutamine-hydrolysing)